MNILSIIDKIYESSHFSTYLIIAILSLIVLFIVVLIMGIRDSKKVKKEKIEVEEDVKDITFDIPKELDNIKEDVTFEMPSLTQNLENFKKSLEEEIKKEEMAEVRKTSGLILPKEKKTVKVFDLDKIEDTSILPINIEEKELLNNKENIKNGDMVKSMTKDRTNTPENRIFAKGKESLNQPNGEKRMHHFEQKSIRERNMRNVSQVRDRKVIKEEVRANNTEKKVVSKGSNSIYSMDDDF